MISFISLPLYLLFYFTDSLPEENKVSQQDAPEIVLVISLNGANGSPVEPPGLLSEHEVFEMHSTRNMGNPNLHSEAGGIPPLDSATLNDADSERMDKRLRFSLYSTGKRLMVEVHYENGANDFNFCEHLMTFYFLRLQRAWRGRNRSDFKYFRLLYG